MIRACLILSLGISIVRLDLIRIIECLREGWTCIGDEVVSDVPFVVGMYAKMSGDMEEDAKLFLFFSHSSLLVVFLENILGGRRLDWVVQSCFQELALSSVWLGISCFGLGWWHCVEIKLLRFMSYGNSIFAPLLIYSIQCLR